LIRKSDPQIYESGACAGHEILSKDVITYKCNPTMTGKLCRDKGGDVARREAALQWRIMRPDR
jgi:hypothetical protein